MLLLKSDFFLFSILGPTELISSWKSKNQKSRAELFIDFFEFFALSFRLSEFVVSIRHVGGIAKTEKQWHGKKLAVEDPFSVKRNLTRSVNSATVLDFIMDCFKIGYLYFGTIQTTQGPVILKILVPDQAPVKKNPENDNGSNCEPEDILSKLKLSPEKDLNQTTLPKTVMTLEVNKNSKKLISFLIIFTLF